MLNIFLTGATGYLGGEVLYAIAKALTASQVSISCLVRDSAKAEVVRKAFPHHVQTIEGALDDTEIIESESQKADVVMHLASTNHIKSAQAIAKGLGQRSQKTPSYWLQMSGASLFVIPEVKNSRYGEHSDTCYDDLDDIDKIIKVIENSPTRLVDNLIMAQNPTKIRTALIVGPLIYGQGHGPVNTRSIQAPELTRSTIAWKQGFRFNAGLNRWSNIHVGDIAAMFVCLLRAASDGVDNVWNRNGIYLPENGVMTFGELCERIAGQANDQNLIPSPKVEKVIGPAEADEVSPHGSVLFGTNAILKSSRARKLLQWKPVGPSLEETLPEMIKMEAERSRK